MERHGKSSKLHYHFFGPKFVKVSQNSYARFMNWEYGYTPFKKFYWILYTLFCCTLVLSSQRSLAGGKTGRNRTKWVKSQRSLRPLANCLCHWFNKLNQTATDKVSWCHQWRTHCKKPWWSATHLKCCPVTSCWLGVLGTYSHCSATLSLTRSLTLKLPLYRNILLLGNQDPERFGSKAWSSKQIQSFLKNYMHNTGSESESLIKPPGLDNM